MVTAYGAQIRRLHRGEVKKSLARRSPRIPFNAGDPARGRPGADRDSDQGNRGALPRGSSSRGDAAPGATAYRITRARTESEGLPHRPPPALHAP